MTRRTNHMENDLFFEPEAGYWQSVDRLQYETANLEAGWPAPGNPFVSVRVQRFRRGQGVHGMKIGDFKQLIGALMSESPSFTARVLIIPEDKNGRTISACLYDLSDGAMPPLRADNCGSMELAFSWLASKLSHFEASFAADGSFWVHPQ